MGTIGMTPAASRFNRDISVRVQTIDKRGVKFENPITVFKGANGPGGLGSKLSFQIYQTTGVATVEILRNTANDAASATVIQSYPVNELALNQPINYYDHDKSIVNQNAHYWVRAVPLHAKFAPIIEGPQVVAVPNFGDTTLASPNETTNTGNFATVDSIDAGTTATVRIYGTGGVGTSWTRATGNGFSPVFPAGQILGLAYSTPYFIFWNAQLPSSPGGAYVAVTSFAAGLNDNWNFAGLVTTVAHGGGGGTSGGGGTGGSGGGCCEVGTPLKFPDGADVRMWLVDCEEWISVRLTDGKAIRVAPGTLVSLFECAEDLEPGMHVELENGDLGTVSKVSRELKSSKKMSLRVAPGGTYWGGGIRLHNAKPLR